MGFLTVYFNDFLLRIEWNLDLFSRTEMQVPINSISQATSWRHSPWPVEEPWVCRFPKDPLWGNVHSLSLSFSHLRCELFISMEMWILYMLISLQHQHIPKQTIQQGACFQVSCGSLTCVPCSVRPHFWISLVYKTRQLHEMVNIQIQIWKTGVQVQAWCFFSSTRLKRLTYAFIVCKKKVKFNFSNLEWVLSWASGSSSNKW